MVRPKPDQPDRLLRPCGQHNHSVGQYNHSVGQYNCSVSQYNDSVGLGSCKWSIGSDSLLKIPEAILAPENEARLNDALFLGTVEPPVPGGAQDLENACN